jgi:hypothetical protein
LPVRQRAQIQEVPRRQLVTQTDPEGLKNA